MKTLKKLQKYEVLKYLVLILPLFFICIQNANSVEITEKEVQVCYRGESIRGGYFLNELSAIGMLELDNILAFRGGFSVGRTIIDTEINTLVSVIYAPFSFPLDFSVSYIYNGLPEYQAHANSVIPLISYHGRLGGTSFGCNFRFTNFFGTDAQFETHLTFHGYFKFINTQSLTVWVGAGNFRDFNSKNLGAFSLDFNAEIRLKENWTFVNEVEFMQSGGDGLTSTLYGMAFRTGVKYSW